MLRTLAACFVLEEANMDNKVWRNPVFLISALVILVLVDAIGRIANILYEFMTIDFSWFYLLTVFIIVVFLIELVISKYGSIRLAGEGERPEFPFFYVEQYAFFR